jgi:transcriptional regulator with PAS, ATPase and Fis domain
MPTPRRLLWIAAAQHFPSQIADRSPELDVVWEPDAERAAQLDIDEFEAAVVDLRIEARDRALEVLRRRRKGLPVVFWVPPDAVPAAKLAIGRREVSLADTPEIPERSRNTPELAGVIGDSAPFRAALLRVVRAATSEVPVLLEGETGTGKEVLARALHKSSRRAERPFVAINCAALSENLLESELFGHLRGSFTGADRDRRGLLEEAHTGTLFLDEIAETSPAFQAKLLRVLQERELRPVGALRSRPVDFRVVSATHRNLRSEISAGRFREDLFYRIAVFPIEIPSLRERRADIAALARHFIRLHDTRGLTREIVPAAERHLEQHNWPGNVRELENEIRHALACAVEDERLLPSHFSTRIAAPGPLEIASATAPARLEARLTPREVPENLSLFDPLEGSRAGAKLEPPAASRSAGLRERLEAVEAQYIRDALQENGGRRSRTAIQLGLTREGLYKKMRRLEIE